MELNQVLFKFIFSFILLLSMSTSADAQACSINTGGDIFICNDIALFELLGGGTPDVLSLEWSNNDSGIFTIMDPSDPMSPVTVNTPSPAGEYTFILTGICEGDVLVDEITVTISDEVTSASIIALEILLLSLSGSPVGVFVKPAFLVLLISTLPFNELAAAIPIS